MEHCGAAGLGAEEPGVGGDDGDGLGGSFHQDVEHSLAVGIGDCGNGLGQCEDEMEIRRGQDPADLAVEPLVCGAALAGRAVTISAGVVKHMRFVALAAPIKARPHLQGAAVANGRERLAGNAWERCAIAFHEHVTGVAEDLRHAGFFTLHSAREALSGMVELFEHRGRDAGVDPGALGRLVPEHVLHFVARGAAFKQVRGE